MTSCRFTNNSYLMVCFNTGNAKIYSSASSLSMLLFNFYVQTDNFTTSKNKTQPFSYFYTINNSFRLNFCLNNNFFFVSLLFALRLFRSYTQTVLDFSCHFFFPNHLRRKSCKMSIASEQK